MARKKVVEVKVKTRKVDENMYAIIKRQLITEKSNQAEKMNQYTFEVCPDANKSEIKDAVEAIFEVKVRSVNVANTRSHQKRMGRFVGEIPGFKKAVVTLLDGYQIDAAKKLG